MVEISEKVRKEVGIEPASADAEIDVTDDAESLDVEG
jgi:hypothetical protein